MLPSACHKARASCNVREGPRSFRISQGLRIRDLRGFGLKVHAFECWFESTQNFSAKKIMAVMLCRLEHSCKISTVL